MEHNLLFSVKMFDAEKEAPVWCDGKRISVMNRQEAICDAEVTMQDNPKLFNKVLSGCKKSFNNMKGKILKNSDMLMEPELAEEILIKRCEKEYES